MIGYDYPMIVTFWVIHTEIGSEKMEKNVPGKQRNQQGEGIPIAISEKVDFIEKKAVKRYKVKVTINRSIQQQQQKSWF